MNLPEKWKQHLNRLFRETKERGIMVVAIAIDPEKESVELLYNPNQADQAYALTALQMFMDGLKQEEKDNATPRQTFIC